jgi:hypothetical protein
MIPVNLWFSMIFLGCSILGVISSLLLIIGLRKDQREFLAPFIIIMSLDLFIEFLHFVILMIFGESKFDPLTGTLFTVDFFVSCLNVSYEKHKYLLCIWHVWILSFTDVLSRVCHFTISRVQRISVCKSLYHCKLFIVHSFICRLLLGKLSGTSCRHLIYVQCL